MLYEVLPRPYKVWVLNDNTIENIFIFNDKKETAFSEEDLDTMMEFGITKDNEIIIESPVQIHADDSIMQIKKKIINEFGKESGVAYHELYLFAYIEKFIDPYAIFYESVPKNTNYLNRETCNQLLHNILDEFDDLDENKVAFTYDDFAKIVGPSRKLDIPIGLGMLPSSNHLFSPNPFYASEFSPKKVVHTDNILLFNHGTIIGNNIFVCLAGDVIERAENDEFMVKTYYPLLATKSIFDMDSLLTKRQQLTLETDKMMDRRHFNSYKMVDSFYNIARTKPAKQLEYAENGIRKFVIVMKPAYSFSMPLELIFKNIHASPKYKFIKLNLGIRRENIYRIYSNKISKTGRKIPSISMDKINSLSKRIGKQKQLSFYVNDSDLYIDIENDGAVTISWEFKSEKDPVKAIKTDNRYMKILEIQNMLLRDVNPLLENINRYLQNGGHKIPMIETIIDSNIEIKSMDYVASIAIKQKPKKKKNTESSADDGKIVLKRDIGCIYTMFDIISDFNDNNWTSAELRFKRVNNYREMDQQALLIKETFNKKGRESDVLEALMLNHNMTVEEATKRIAQHLKDAEYREIDGNTIEIVDNPGFPIKMQITESTMTDPSKLEFVAENISHLGYIDSLSKYFESMMRILQKSESCEPMTKDDVAIEENVEKLVKPTIHERVSAFDFSPSSPMERGDQGEQGPEEEGEDRETLIASPTIAFKNIQKLMDVSEDAKEDYILNSDESSDLDLTGVDIEEDDDLDITGIDVEEGEEGEKGEKNDSIYGGGPAASSSEESLEDAYQTENKERAKNTNPFLLKLQKMAPDVILQGKDGRSNVYSRSCQSYRQPVILSADEKKRIDRKSPGSYTKAMQSGDNYYICPRYWCFKNNVSMTEEQVERGECDKEYLFEFKNQANPLLHTDPATGKYIEHYPGFTKKQGVKNCMPCCFATAWDTWSRENPDTPWENQSKTIKWENGVKFTKKGKGKEDWKPSDDKETVDETGTIRKFDEQTGEWIIDENMKEQPKHIEKCDETVPLEKASKNISSDLSILNPDTKKTLLGKFAFLQYAVQHFMNVDYDGKYKTINGTKYLNNGVETFLRYGIEHASLLGCLADLTGMKGTHFGKTLANAVELDEFAKYGNASFTAIFRPELIEVGDEIIITDVNNEIWTKDETGEWKNPINPINPLNAFPAKVKSMKINPDNYSNTELFKTMKSVSSQESFWETFAAYEIYKLYLSNPDIKIEYTYVWDLVSRPNSKLFKQGINMAIMELSQNDITDSIDLICPTNTYSKTKFDIDKPTVFLIKNGQQFEPVYLYNSETTDITRTFTKSSAVVKPLIKMMHRTLNNYCRPKSSMPDIYNYEQPILLDELMEILKKLSYVIKCQILNYQGKTIALQVTNPNTKKSVSVPCNPSAPLAAIEKKYMDDEQLWIEYDDTRTELEALYEASGKKIPCNPMLKMTEDKTMVIGILTRSNQLVPIKPPTNVVKGDGLPELSNKEDSLTEFLVNKNTIGADVALTRDSTGDAQRLIIIRNARIESEMYSLFRATIKTLLAKPENYGTRDYLIVETQNAQTKKDSIKKIVKKLVSLTRGTVEFEDFDENSLIELGKLDGIEYTCGKNKKSALLKDGCKLILPLNNILVPERDNRLLYYYRVADELLRFKQYSSFMLNSKQILNTGDTDYKVNIDEFIVLESSLTGNYYDNQTEFLMNQYMSGEIPYEQATAEKKITEPNIISLDIQNMGNVQEIDLLHNSIDKRVELTGDRDIGFWIRDVFKTKKGNDIELVFKKCDGEMENCIYTFGPFLKIMSELDNVKYNNPDDVREILWNSYKDLITPIDDPVKQRNFEKIVAILRDRQGKSAMMKSIVGDISKFEAIVRSSAYFMTTLDLYVLAQKMKLPIILFTNNTKANTVNSLDDLGFEGGIWLILGKRNEKSSDNKFYFVRAQKRIEAKTPISVPAHSMVYKSFAITELNVMKDRIMSAFQGKEWRDNMASIEEFLA